MIDPIQSAAKQPEPNQGAAKQPETIRIGGVRFLKDEVLGIDKKTAKGMSSVFVVQTTHGRYEFLDGPYKGDNPSIMNGVVKDVYLDFYTGTKNTDKIKLENSTLGAFDLSGDVGKRDTILLDGKSYGHCYEWPIKKDSDDVVLKDITDAL